MDELTVNHGELMRAMLDQTAVTCANDLLGQFFDEGGAAK
jgi:hypothetical protein